LYTKNKKIQARVKADGSLSLKGKDGCTFQGSIHKVGAHAQNAESCNGWTYWHFEERTGLKPIDFLRDKIRNAPSSSTARTGTKVKKNRTSLSTNATGNSKKINTKKRA